MLGAFAGHHCGVRAACAMTQADVAVFVTDLNFKLRSKNELQNVVAEMEAQSLNEQQTIGRL